MDLENSAAKAPKANQRNSYRTVTVEGGEKVKGNAEVVISHKSIKPKSAQRVEHKTALLCQKNAKII